MGGLEQPSKSSVNSRLQVQSLVSTFSMNLALSSSNYGFIIAKDIGSVPSYPCVLSCHALPYVIIRHVYPWSIDGSLNWRRLLFLERIIRPFFLIPNSETREARNISSVSLSILTDSYRIWKMYVMILLLCVFYYHRTFELYNLRVYLDVRVYGLSIGLNTLFLLA